MKKKELLKKWKLTERDYNLIIELYEHLGMIQKDEEWTNENIDNDLTHDYLSEYNVKNEDYYIYTDENHDGYISKKTSKVCTEEKQVEKLLGADV